MVRAFLLAIALLAPRTGIGYGQSTEPPSNLTAIVHAMETHTAGRDAQWLLELSNVVSASTLADIKQNLPSIVALSESSDPQLRGNALLILYGIAARQQTGLPENRRAMDPAGAELIVPYITRLAPRLTDDDTPCRSLSLLLFQTLTIIRPTPPELLTAALRVLQDQQSTQQTTDTTNKSPDRRAPSVGPQMLWVIIPAGATFQRDPGTGITEGSDSLEVQQAIVTFLRRSDQTTESLSESIRAIALAQAQNPKVNSALLHLLDSTDTTVVAALLRQLPRLIFTAQDFSSAKDRVLQLAGDPHCPLEVRDAAKVILPCWVNDRHKGLCPMGS